MADIELLIKIPEDDYEKIKRTSIKNGAKDELDYMRELILSGTPLPKGHGRLIDAEYLKQDMIRYGWHHVDCTVHEYVEDMLPTIIEADKEVR